MLDKRHPIEINYNLRGGENEWRQFKRFYIVVAIYS